MQHWPQVRKRNLKSQTEGTASEDENDFVIQKTSTGFAQQYQTPFFSRNTYLLRRKGRTGSTPTLE